MTFQSKAIVVPNGSCKRNPNLRKDGCGIPKSSKSSYENTPNVDSTELNAAAAAAEETKGGEEIPPDNSAKAAAAVMSDEVEEDSGRGSASTPLAGHFRSRYAVTLCMSFYLRRSRQVYVSLTLLFLLVTCCS